jgi:hypothetical protein
MSDGLDRFSLEPIWLSPQMAFMTLITAAFWSKHLWGGMSLLAAMTVLVSSVADRRRQRRTRIENVGFMPWTAITVMATLAAVIFAALAIKTG